MKKGIYFGTLPTSLPEERRLELVKEAGFDGVELPQSPTDEDSRIAKMQDGRTHLAHKAEHAVDMDSQAIVAVTLVWFIRDEQRRRQERQRDVSLGQHRVALGALRAQIGPAQPGSHPARGQRAVAEQRVVKGQHVGRAVVGMHRHRPQHGARQPTVERPIPACGVHPSSHQ